MASVVPLCPEGKPFDSSGFFSLLFTILIYAMDLGCAVWNFSLEFLVIGGKSFLWYHFIPDQGMH